MANEHEQAEKDPDICLSVPVDIFGNTMDSNKDIRVWKRTNQIQLNRYGLRKRK